MAEQVAAQIVHDLLAGPLHQVGLDKGEAVTGYQANNIDESQDVEPGQRVDRQMARNPVGGDVRPRQQIAVHSHLHQIRASHIADRFNGNSDGGNYGLQPIVAQIRAQTTHQPAIVDLAGGIVVRLAR